MKPIKSKKEKTLELIIAASLFSASTGITPETILSIENLGGLGSNIVLAAEPDEKTDTEQKKSDNQPSQPNNQNDSAQSQNIEYKAVKTYTKSTKLHKKTINVKDEDYAGIHIKDGANVKAEQITINKKTKNTNKEKKNSKKSNTNKTSAQNVNSADSDGSNSIPESSQPAGSNSNNQNTPENIPEKPTDGSTNDSTNDNSSGMQQPPEKPAGEQNMNGQNGTVPPDIPDNDQNMQGDEAQPPGQPREMKQSNSDTASFYGTGSAIVATGGKADISKANISTKTDGSAGVFAYGNGKIKVTDSKIRTTGDKSGGIHVAGGGTLTAKNLDVYTKGNSSAAIRSDRGGGTLKVNKGTYISNGTGSPAVYSTADISVSNAVLKANNSEAVCIEGKNSLKLKNTDLSGNMKKDSQNDTTWNVILYQSMSGDSEEGTAEFSMDGGRLKAGKKGGMFYTTNTKSEFTLKNVSLHYSDDNDYLLRVSGNSNQRGWGQKGSNGANCTFTAVDQKMKGKIIWDDISTLDLNLKGKTAYTGKIVKEENQNKTSSDTESYANITVGKNAVWTVTGDSTVSKLTNKGTIKDKSGNSVTVKDSSGNILSQGTSQYTITVDEYIK